MAYPEPDLQDRSQASTGPPGHNIPDRMPDPPRIVGPHTTTRPLTDAYQTSPALPGPYKIPTGLPLVLQDPTYQTRTRPPDIPDPTRNLPQHYQTTTRRLQDLHRRCRTSQDPYQGLHLSSRTLCARLMVSMSPHALRNPPKAYLGYIYIYIY